MDFADLYLSDYYIICSVTPDPLIIEPTASSSQMSISPGHIHEVHYVSLEPILSNENEQSCEVCQTADINSTTDHFASLIQY